MFKRNVVILIIVLAGIVSAVSSLHAAPVTMVLQPDSAVGQDALICDRIPTLNSGGHINFVASAWTNDNEETITRSLIRFAGLAPIPSNATIINARLFLFNDSTSHLLNPPGRHSNNGGSNESYLRRINLPWDEAMVTWANQPTVTALNEVLLPEHTDVHMDYVVDVTGMVQDMITLSDNNGFMLQLDTEEHYRGLLFASSDHPNPDLRPRLEVTYDILTDKHSVKFVCGSPMDDELTHTPVTPGVYATEINIFNDDEEREATIQKQFSLLVYKGDAIGRERSVSENPIMEDPLVLPQNGATMDDCYRIAEMVYGSTPDSLSSMPLTIGFLKIESSDELRVDAVYSATDRGQRSVSTDVEHIPAKPVE